MAKEPIVLYGRGYVRFEEVFEAIGAKEVSFKIGKKVYEVDGDSCVPLDDNGNSILPLLKRDEVLYRKPWEATFSL